MSGGDWVKWVVIGSMALAAIIVLFGMGGGPPDEPGDPRVIDEEELE